MPTYNLQKGSPQWKYSESRAKIQGMAGSFANGKSTAMIIKTLKLLKSYPGMSAMMGRSTYPKLNSTLRKDFLRWCPPNWIKRKPTQDDNTCIMINGSEVHFRYVAQRGKSQEDGSTTSNLLSATYDLVVLDQMEDPEIEYKDFQDLLGRLRGSTPYSPERGEEDMSMPRSGPRWFLFGVNPTRNWVYTEVVHPYHVFKNTGKKLDKLIVDSKSGEPLLDLIEGDIYSNAHNLEDDYISTLEGSFKGQMKDRFVLGKWAAYEGLVYGQYNEDVHLLSRETMLDHLFDCLDKNVQIKVLESYDFGITAPSCYLFAFSDDFGRVFVLDGFHKGDFDYKDQPVEVARIRALYCGNKLKIKDLIKADPNIFRKQMVHKLSAGTTVAQLLSDLGMRTKPAMNNITAGLTKVGSYLVGKKGVPHIVTGVDPGPLLYFASELTFIQDEIGNYYWKKNPQGQRIDEPMDLNDHAMDAAKYLLSDLPEPAKIVLPRDRLPPGWMRWHEMERSEFQRAQKQSV